MTNFRVGGLFNEIETHTIQYFHKQKINRYNFIYNLLSVCGNKTKNMNFLSIGCGLAGEESWLTERFNEVVLVDRNENKIRCASSYFSEQKIKGNYEFKHADIKNLKLKKKFDIIFTSSPSDWMRILAWRVPEYYLDFLRDHLSDNGIFVVRFYGGNVIHGPTGIRNSTFPITLKKDFKKRGFKVQGIYYRGVQELNKENKKNGFPNEFSKGRQTQCLAIITRENFSDDSVPFFNYDKDNIYPIEYRFDNIVEYDHKCQELIKSIYDNDLKNKLKNTF